MHVDHNVVLGEIYLVVKKTLRKLCEVKNVRLPLSKEITGHFILVLKLYLYLNIYLTTATAISTTDSHQRYQRDINQNSYLIEIPLL